MSEKNLFHLQIARCLATRINRQLERALARANCGDVRYGRELRLTLTDLEQFKFALGDLYQSSAKEEGDTHGLAHRPG